MAKRHPSVIATCVVTQQAQRRHSADISEREHRPQRLAKVCHRRLTHPHQRDVFRSHDRQSVAGVAWPESAATASPELALDVCGSDAPASSAATLLARRKRVRSRHEGAGLRRVTRKITGFQCAAWLVSQSVYVVDVFVFHGHTRPSPNGDNSSL